MTTEETIEKIMTDDDFVVSEVNKLRVLYALKKEIRYDHERIHESHTESVAEHIWAMHCLADYFFPLVNPEKNWDKQRIHEMIQYHDIDEIETGDIVGYKKTEEDYAREASAAKLVISKLPETLKAHVKELLDEFEAQKTPESKYAKAIDKLESVIQMYSQEGKDFLHKIKYDRQKHEEYKRDYIAAFPIMHRFETVMADQYEKEGIYYTDS